MLPEQQQRIMGYFIEEAKDHLNTIEQGLLSLQATIEDADKANELFRAAHSVKGGAAMLGLESIQTTAHRMEDYFKILKESPVQVDSTLETMFLRISDGLKDLLEQLEGPFGLTQEKAKEIMTGVDPVFGQLASHLNMLVAASGTAASAAVSGRPLEVLQTSFKTEVTALLRKLLTTFKQADTVESRKSVQAICTQLSDIGKPFELAEWCDLIETARIASANLNNEYRVLAPVLIKEIKKSQELVLANRASEVAVSETMQALLPEDILATSEALESTAELPIDEIDEVEPEDTTFDVSFLTEAERIGSKDLLENDLFEADFETGLDSTGPDSTGPDSEDEELDELFGFDTDASDISALSELDLDNEADAEIASTDQENTILETATVEPTNHLNLDLDFDEIPSELSSLNRDENDNERVDESLDALLATVNVTGPDVGTEELNSLADLFDGDLDELDNTLGGHPFVSEEMRLHPEKIDVEEEDDLSDFLLGDESSDAENDPDSLLDTSDELEDDLFGGTLTEGGFANSADVLSGDVADLDEDIWNETSQDESSPTAEGQDHESSQLLGDDLLVSELFGDDDAADQSFDSQNFDREKKRNAAENEAAADALTTAVEESSESLSHSQPVGTLTGSLFSGKPISPSEQEIAFPTLTGVELEEAEQDIDSFFFDTDGAKAIDSSEEIAVDNLAELGEPEGEQTPSASTDEQVSDDPWGELAMDTASSSSLEQDTDSNYSEFEFSAVEHESEDATLSGLSAEADLATDLFDSDDSLPFEVDLDVEQAGSELDDLLGDASSPDTPDEADDLWGDLSSSENTEDSAVDDLVTDVAKTASTQVPVDSGLSVDVGLQESPAEIEISDIDDLFEQGTESASESDSFSNDSFLDDSSANTAGVSDDFLDFEDDDSSGDLSDDLLIAPTDDIPTDEFSTDEFSTSEALSTQEEWLDDTAEGTVSTLEDQTIPDIEATNAAEQNERLDDFDDLESLLAEEAEETATLSAAVDSTPTAVGTVSANQVALEEVALEEDEDFDDLERLLEEGDSESAIAPRRVAPRPARRTGTTREQNMRVPVKHLDNLSNLVGELVVSRNTLERDQERLRQFLDNLLFQVQQLNDVGQRMRDLYERSLLESSLVSNRRAYAAGHSQEATPEGHATGATFDALEMDRFTGFHTLSQEMIELIVRVRESSSDIGYTVESSDQVTRQFRQITTQLQEGLNTARMVAFSQAADRLPRAVRDIALKCGKEARLIVDGKDTLIDKMIVEHLYDPLTHLVNNAITHGIETPAERKAAGKLPEGNITVQAFYQGNQTVIYVADDGGGINPAFVQRKAVEKKLISQAEADGLSDIETYELLFHPGFSTRDQADDFAGRGVGMDVVRTSLAEIRGVITIDSEQGKGTSFTIRLPLTLSISKALSCVSNQARIAFPMDGVEDMLDVPGDRIVKNEQGQDCVKWRDRMLPFQAVTDLLKFNRTLGRGRVYGGSQEDDVLSIIVLRSASTFVAIQVDQVIGEEEIVIKQLEGPVPKPLGIAGATILGDGRVMPIADVLELIDIAMGRVRREPSSLLWAEAAEEAAADMPVKTDPTVLIVDDSITVRELLSMSFNKVGYRVEQARDGQEAWDKLRSGLPCDLVFCDIEMPRMDGLELLSRMQKDNHLKQVPIAMLTSRGADRHRQMAVDLGASGYFTKPYLEEALLDAAQRMLNGETLEKGRGG